MVFVEHSLRRLKVVIQVVTEAQAVSDDRVAKYVDRLKEQHHITESAVVHNLVDGRYDQVVRELHVRYQRGELTFRAVAAELGLTVRELYDLFEQKELPL